MAQVYGQSMAQIVQQTSATCNSSEWILLEATTSTPSTEGGTSALPRRFGTEIYNKGQAATAKLYLYMTNTTTAPTVSVKYCKPVETGAYHFEPNNTGLKLWGRTQAATARVIVTEYGE